VAVWYDRNGEMYFKGGWRYPLDLAKAWYTHWTNSAKAKKRIRSKYSTKSKVGDMRTWGFVFTCKQGCTWKILATIVQLEIISGPTRNSESTSIG
jgi:hypothetical protein